MSASYPPNTQSSSSGDAELRPDENILGGPRTPQQISAHKRLQKTQAEVDDVVQIMKTNVEKVLERDHNISAMENKSEGLADGAKQFVQQTDKMRKKFWLKNMKMIVIIGGTILVILVILIAKLSPSSPQTPAAATTTLPLPKATPVATVFNATTTSGIKTA